MLLQIWLRSGSKWGGGKKQEICVKHLEADGCRGSVGVNEYPYTDALFFGGRFGVDLERTRGEGNQIEGGVPGESGSVQ